MSTDTMLSSWPLDSALSSAVMSWHDWLAHERRTAHNTLKAYVSDLEQCLGFLSGHHGTVMTLAHLADTPLADFRAWLAWRANQGYAPASSARAVSTVRGFFRFLARHGLAENPAIETLRNPKQPRLLPRPLEVEDIRETLAFIAQDTTQEPWISLRDVALFTLIWACGLRIGEALALNRDHVAPSLVITGKGGKQRVINVLPPAQDAISHYLSACPP